MNLVTFLSIAAVTWKLDSGTVTFKGNFHAELLVNSFCQWPSGGPTKVGFFYLINII